MLARLPSMVRAVADDSHAAVEVIQKSKSKAPKAAVESAVGRFVTQLAVFVPGKVAFSEDAFLNEHVDDICVCDTGSLMPSPAHGCRI